jgi:bacterioferritin (cytochrome b1)
MLGKGQERPPKTSFSLVKRTFPTGSLNEAIGKEVAVSIQYMWQHVQVIGVKAVAVQDQFKQTAITEMKHAEKIAERLW